MTRNRVQRDRGGDGRADRVTVRAPLLTVVLILLSGPFVIIGLGGSVDPEGMEDSPGRTFFVCMAGIALAMMIRPMFIRVTAEPGHVVVAGLWRTRKFTDVVGVSVEEGSVGRGRGLIPTLHRRNRETCALEEFARYGTTIAEGASAERRARRIADALGVPCRLGPVRGRGRSGWVSFF